MGDTAGPKQREAALDRARNHSPFLNAALEALPTIGDTFRESGSEAAIPAALGIDHPDVSVRLRCQRRALALAVALGDLSGELSLEQLTGHLSDFADRAIDQALAAAVTDRQPGASSDGISIIALGKLGSRELNYSSDVDLILLFDPQTVPRRAMDDAESSALRIARKTVELLQQRTSDGYVARVDLRLRPSPEVTPIILPVNAAISYYESQALPWERAAFIRARAAAGDRELGARFLEEIQPFIWRRTLDFGAIEEIRDISARIRDHYMRGQSLGPGFDLKRGVGGIREAEFFVQVQQLIHGGRNRALRPPAVLDALPALAADGRLDPVQARHLADAYRRLRTVEHRVQMIDDQQIHRLPVDPAALTSVAALDGLSGGEALLSSLQPHVRLVATCFDELVTERGRTLPGDEASLRLELSDMGFTELAAPLALIASWRSGQARSLRSPSALKAFEAMLPAMLGQIAHGPEPIRSLNRLADIVERISSGINLYRLLEAQPRLTEIMGLILSHAPTLADQLARRPALLDGLIDASSFLQPLDVNEAADLLRGEPSESYDTTLDRVRRAVGERRFALGVQLVTGHRDPLELAEGYAALAEGTIVTLAEAAAREFERAHGRIEGGELLILALGRLGGMALTHASDLDLVFLYNGPQSALSDGARPLGPADYFNRLAKRVVGALSVPTAAGPLYEVDTRLRPQGEQGMLAVHVDAFSDYQRSEAWTWEHMALLRARPVHGSDVAKAELGNRIVDVLGMARDARRVRTDAAKMRAEMQRHKPPAGPLDVKLGPGGLVDLEFAVHTLQLVHRRGFCARLEDAIAMLVSAGLLDGQVDHDLRLLSRMLVASRLIAPGGAEPEPQSRQLAAELCGMPDWKTLIAEHDHARQRVTELWQRVRKQG